MCYKYLIFRHFTALEFIVVNAVSKNPANAIAGIILNRFFIFLKNSMRCSVFVRVRFRLPNHRPFLQNLF